MRMQYWTDRVHSTNDASELTYIPISFVTDDPVSLESLVAPNDEVVSDVTQATKEWTFLLKKGDVFPVQIIASIHSTFESIGDEPFDAMMFPIVYRGHPVEERRLFRTKGDYLNVQHATMPIFNLNPPPQI
jgi:hypothetical protein